MKMALLLGLVACGGGATAPAVGSGSGSGSNSQPTEIDLCVLGHEALDTLKQCNGKPTLQAAQQFNGVLAMVKKDPAMQTTCAQMLHTLDENFRKDSCSLPLSPAARTRMYDLVEAWYATRTPVTPTGNPAADAVIAKVVEIRDTACKCNTELCLEGVQKSLDTITPFAADAPEVARTLGTALLDDVSRCSARITKPVVRH